MHIADDNFANKRTLLFVSIMVFSAEYRIVIKNLVVLKVTVLVNRLMKEFLQKNWNFKNGLDALLCKIHATGTVDRKPNNALLCVPQIAVSCFTR